MFGLEKMFGSRKKEISLTKEEVAVFLKTTPEALEAFEVAYEKGTLGNGVLT